MADPPAHPDFPRLPLPRQKVSQRLRTLSFALPFLTYACRIHVALLAPTLHPLAQQFYV